MTSTAATHGTVREWHSEEGWGVIDSPETPGGCWSHFSYLDGPGYKELATGQQVLITFEPADQDGYAFRALHVWTQGPEPQPWPPPSDGTSEAYRSRLTVLWDEA